MNRGYIQQNNLETIEWIHNDLFSLNPVPLSNGPPRVNRTNASSLTSNTTVSSTQLALRASLPIENISNASSTIANPVQRNYNSTTGSRLTRYVSNNDITYDNPV